MKNKLYHHKTDGGAEYLCTKAIKGTNEGDLMSAIVRLDGENPELIGKFETIEHCYTDLLTALDFCIDEIEKWNAGKTHDIGAAFEDAVIASAKAKGN